MKENSFALMIKDTREHQGHSLSEAAELIGCSKAHLWDMERGRSVNPTIQILAGIACAYDIDLGDLAHAAACSAPGTDYRAAVREVVKAGRHLKIVAERST